MSRSWGRGAGLLAAGVALAAAVAVAAPEPDRFVVCYPNAPGSARSAEPIMGKLSEYLGARLGRSIKAAFFNDLARAEGWLAQRPARDGIVSLPLYLRWRESKKLTAVAHAERGGSALERYYLIVSKAAKPTSLAQLDESVGAREPRIWSPHLDDARFGTNVVFARKLVIKEVKHKRKVAPAFKSGRVRVVSSTRMLGAIKRMVAGEPYKGEPVDAVLVDQTFWSGLQKLERFKGVLRVLYASPPFPTAPVVTFDGASQQDGERLKQALLSMKTNGQGQAILKTLQSTGFVAAQTEALTKLAEAYAEKVD